MVRLMRWDRHTLTAFGGIAAMAHASHERLRQRIEALEQRLAQAEWRDGINRAE
jgi:BMFP domain-containing protein YqiC